MRNILSRLLATGNFDIQIFGDKVILDEGNSSLYMYEERYANDSVVWKEIENWPISDFLITFFSSGFPIDKTIEYVSSTLTIP